ncbi:class I SAM-dependent methyltransferase, partial [bacterium]|nr:class I SAM-dependent methyltransferase [bacterium]
MGSGFIRYPPSDEKVFLAGYEAMRWKDLSGGLAVEICGGHGELAARFAKAEPRCRVIGTDLYIPDYPENRNWLKELPNLSYQKASAFDLTFLEPSSVDLLWGQAALHHLSHAPQDVCREAHNGLRLISRKIDSFPLSSDPTPKEYLDLKKKWTDWYL